jgi:hypothetical protein
MNKKEMQQQKGFRIPRAYILSRGENNESIT